MCDPIFDVELHADVCRQAKKQLDAILSEGRFSGLDVWHEDLKDGKITYRFSFTAQHSKTTEVKP